MSPFSTNPVASSLSLAQTVFENLLSWLHVIIRFPLRRMSLDAALECRWGFLTPWCNILLYRIHFRTLEDVDHAPADLFGAPERVLQVILPTRAGIYGEYKDEATFQLEFQNTREALALLAAVAHVDYQGWKYLLANHCGVDFGLNRDHVEARFVLLMAHQAETDLIQLCGVNQRRFGSPGFVNLMRKIAEMDGRLSPKNPGVDVEIPVRVIFKSSTAYRATNGPIPILVSIQNAEKMIRDEWESYNWSLENQPVEPGQLRCTFMLEPVLGDLRELGCGPEIAETMAKFIGENVRFSRLVVKAECDKRMTPMSFRQMMAVVFDATRRSQELANTKYCAEQVASSAHTTPLQLGNVTLMCEYTLGPSEFEAIFSAIVLTQTTRKLKIRQRINANDRVNRREWWKWLAYGCFSKRARTWSALESLTITDIDDINIADMGDFSAVLSSEHPEEVLYGSLRGHLAEKDMGLRKGALVQWLLTKDGQPQVGSHPFMFSAAVPYVRTFSDDGKSALVDILIPGFSRCLVQRKDLMGHPAPQPQATAFGMKSLTLKFTGCQPGHPNEGLYCLLAACGSSLLFLTIDQACEDVDENAILQNCPNLLELSLRKGWVGVRLDFSEFQSKKESVPKLRVNWQDVGALTKDLCDPHNTFTACVRRLSIDLTNGVRSGNEKWVRNSTAVNRYLDVLLQMLMLNQTLGYLEVIVPPECHNYGDYFRIHHLRPIHRGRTLSTRAKTAFLSVVAAKVTSPSPRTRKPRKVKKAPRRKRQTSPQASDKLDQRILAAIFDFASSPVLRQVYFRENISNDSPPELC
jgi:hypothetical protein